ncbi:MAG: DNA-binding response regulator [Actinobacteria bacterium]|nr:DNA-binding response regulator [Actinomycetota bacterium]
MAATTVLIVDDEEGVRELLCDALRIAGYSPLAAPNGRAALTLLREKSVALVIADINMPQMTGFEMLSKLRAQGNATPVLLLSARGERHDVTEGLRLGADDYVSKPFGLEEILLRVNAILRRTRPDGDNAAIVQTGPLTLNDDTLASSTAVVDTYISYLRRKLHRDNFEGLRTVRGVGYQLVTGE